MSAPIDPTTFTLDVVNAVGTPFRVVAYAPGATGPYPAAADPDRPVVEFYDRRYPHTEHGQFTGARYQLDNLLAERPAGGINLNGGVSAWYIDADTYRLIDTWLGNVHAGMHS